MYVHIKQTLFQERIRLKKYSLDNKIKSLIQEFEKFNSLNTLRNSKESSKIIVILIGD